MTLPLNCGSAALNICLHESFRCHGSSSARRATTISLSYTVHPCACCTTPLLPNLPLYALRAPLSPVPLCCCATAAPMAFRAPVPCPGWVKCKLTEVQPPASGLPYRCERLGVVVFFSGATGEMPRRARQH